MILFYLLIAIMPLSAHRIWETSLGSVTLFKWLGIACVLAALFHLVQRTGPPPLFKTWQARLFLFLYALVLLSYFSKTQATEGWEVSPLAGWTSYFLLFFVTLTLVDSLRRLWWLVVVLVGSLAFASLYVIREWQKFRGVYPGFRTWGGVSGDPNYFSASALIGVALAFCLIWEKQPRWARWFFGGCLAITLTALTIAASRGALLGLFAAFVVLVWRARRRFLFLAVGTVVLVLLMVFAPIAPAERLLHPNYSDEEAAQNREITWKAGMRMMGSAPWFGIGVGNYKGMVDKFEDEDAKVVSVAHNTYIEIGAELGLPALAIFLVILFLSFRSLERVRSQALESDDSVTERMAVGLQAALAGFGVSIVFLSAEYQRHLWFIIFLSMCLPAIQPDAPVETGEIEPEAPEETEDVDDDLYAQWLAEDRDRGETRLR